MQIMGTTTQLQVIVKRLQICFDQNSLLCCVFSGERLDEGTMEVTDQNPNYG